MINGIETDTSNIDVYEAGADDRQLSPHFKLSEFVCKGCDGKCGEQYLHSDIAPMLESIRDYIEQPIIINSGYRCKKHNSKIGGTSRSQHLIGRGVDVTVRDPASTTGQYILDIIARFADERGVKGVKRYKTWVHLDVREGARWVVI